MSSGNGLRAPSHLSLCLAALIVKIFLTVDPGKASMGIIFSCIRYFKTDHSQLILTASNKYVYSVAVYQKYLTRLGELIIFESCRENYHFSQPS